MFSSPTPCTLLVDQIRTLDSELSGVWDGEASSIHDARVATRRIRELLAFVEGPSVEIARPRIKRFGRALGRVRDADVRLELLGELESRIPPAAPMLVTLRQAQARQRQKRMRSMIKRGEQLAIDKTLERLLQNLPYQWRLWQRSTEGWKSHLSRALSARARDGVAAIEHATGVYFPNRVHAARIALKKLRYLMEVGAATGAGDFAGALRDLRKGQRELGDLHDRESLLTFLSSKQWTDERKEAPLDLIRQVVESEIQRLHSRYLTRRAQLLSVSRSIQGLRERPTWMFPALVTASAVALSSGVYLTQQRALGPRLLPARREPNVLPGSLSR
jgi:CHAD domain-containing protein